MIIDLILDRMEYEPGVIYIGCSDGGWGKPYNPRTFYFECMRYGRIADRITLAMDYGTENDIRKALCDYIDENEYNPKIKDYINSQNWL